MTNLPSILSFTASASLLALVISSLLRGRFNYQKLFFIPLVIILASIAFVQGLLLLTRTLSQAETFFRIILALAISSPAFGLSFFLFFARDFDRASILKRLPGIIILTGLLVAAGLTIPLHRIIRNMTFDNTGLFYYSDFTGYGKGLGVFFLLTNVFLVFYLENTYRTANIQGKVTLKYPLLGILAASFINFIVMSRLLSISSIDRRFMALEMCGMIIVSSTFLFANTKYNLFKVMTPPQRGTSSIITIVVAGLYFLSIALISWVSSMAGMSYDRFHLYVLGIFFIFLFFAVGISGRARRRLRQFLNDNFYLERYNYRKEWRHYARLMASSVTINDFLSNTIGSLCETVMVRKGLIWVDIKNGKSATYGLTEENWNLESARKLLNFCDTDEVTVFNRKYHHGKHSSGIDTPGKMSAGTFGWVNAIARLGHSGECGGFIALGEKDTGSPYNEEDRSFLATIADQATITLENLLMGERFLESRQMESFNKFASFVIHDLKNTVGMLSLTAENAGENMADKEFQKDTIMTIRRSVEKMRNLIDSLNAHKSPESINRSYTDIVSLVTEKLESLTPMADSRKVRIEFDPGNRISADVDPAAIRRIVENLMINALEATPENGTVTVNLTPRGKGGFSLEVADTGHGFDPEYIENNMFKPFSSTRKSGLGVGLVLCKTMAEAHGGSISINNVAGKGASVSITIPPAESGQDGKDISWHQRQS